MFKLSKKRITIILFVIVILAITTAAVIFILPKITNKKSVVRDQPIAYEDTKDTIVPEEAAALIELNAILDPETDYWADWSWQAKYAEFIISNLSVADNYIVGYISRPVALSNNNAQIVKHPLCDPTKSIAVSKDDPLRGINAKGFEFMQRASSGDIFYTNCLDEECFNIGNNCVLVEF